MNIYALIPLAATIAYIPLLITTISSRPWQRQHKFFCLFLIAAIVWSLTDFFCRSDFFLEYRLILGKLIVIMFTWMAVQLHCFTSSFFSPGQGRWIPFAYASLALVITAAALGYVPKDIVSDGSKLYPVYGKGVLFVAIPLVILLIRNVSIFWKRLKILDNPVLSNQIISLLLTLFVITVFALAALLPWGREFPVTHFGSIINAFILSYATIRHQLVDIRVVLRRGLALITLGIIGVTSYSFLLISLHIVFRFEFDFTITFIATLMAVLVGTLIYKLHGYLLVTMGKAFQGQSYEYRQKLSDFANKIHHVFSFNEQGAELLTLVTKAIGCKWAYLLFPDGGGNEFSALLIEPKRKENPLSHLRLGEENPIVEYLRREQKPLTRENLAILPEFRSLWEKEKAEIKSSEIELFMPLVSREKLIGILVLGKKQSGRYLLEDFNLLESVTHRVAVSMEKEFLRERLSERERELSIIARSSTIITSSMDIQAIYGSFIEELKKVIEVSWSAIVLIEENDLYFLALFSEIGSAWQAGDRIPIKGTATEWVVTRRQTLVEPDLTQESRFVTGKEHLKQGLRSIAYLPLITKSKVIGSFIVGSCYSNAYSPRHIIWLEQLASQIATPVENSQLYAEAEEKAHVDELTGLFNRRSLDEVMRSEIGRHARYGGIFSIIILDLDSFKAFNDHYGHLAGDKLLKKVGTIIKSTIRISDQAFRYGGDEFAILLPQTPFEAAYIVAERLRQRIASATEVSHVLITASLGLACWPIDGLEPPEVIAAADRALYSAKRNGGNQSHRAAGKMATSDVTIASAENTQDSETLRTLDTLVTAVDSKDGYTHRHSKRVSEYALLLAKALNLESPKIKALETCALLHDIGKIDVADAILNKRGKLTTEEWEAIKAHPQLGATIVSHAHSLTHCLAGILHHHEKYDGSGYPEGLKGEEIPLEARILAIADAFAAMTSTRNYAEALPLEKALEEIKQGVGKQFDPRLVEVFLSAIKTVPGIVTEIRGCLKMEVKTPFGHPD